MSDSPEPTRPSVRTRWLPWLLAWIAGCYFVLFFLRPSLLDVVGVSHYDVWFADTYAILASNDALAAGLDAYANNPLDYFGRAHAYSRWWLCLGKLGLTRADNLWLGVALGLAFFVTASVRLRPQNLRELLWYLAVCCSPPVVLALERANNDLVIFLTLAPLVPCLLSSHRSYRFGAVVLVGFAAGLKFYPAVAVLVLVAGEDRREARLRALVSVAALALVALSMREDRGGFGALARQPQGLLSLGAMLAPQMLGWSGWVSRIVCGVAGLGAAVLWLRSGVFHGWSVKPEDRNAWLSFLLGAALLSGCFFAGNNYAYRLIFSLWLAPLLWRLPRDAQTPFKVRRLAALTAGLLIAVLWITPFLYGILKYLRPRLPSADVKQYADAFLLAEQPLVWAFFICLLGFLTHFLRERVLWLARG